MSVQSPRPQPKASLTLLYFVFIAVSIQILSTFIQNQALSTPERNQNTLETGSELTIDHKQEFIETEEDEEDDFDFDDEDFEEDSLDPEGEKGEFTLEENRSNSKSDSLLLTFAQWVQWAPKDPQAFLPRLFRSQPQEQLVVAEIDDDLLLSEVDQWESIPSESSSLNPLAETQKDKPLSILKEKDPLEPKVPPKEPSTQTLPTTDSSSPSSSHSKSSLSHHQSKSNSKEPPVTLTPHNQEPSSSSSTHSHSPREHESVSNLNPVKSKSNRLPLTALKNKKVNQKESSSAITLSQTTKSLASKTQGSTQTDSLPTSSPKPNPSLVPDSQPSSHAQTSSDLSTVSPKKESKPKRPKRRYKGGVPLYSIEDPHHSLSSFFKSLVQAKQGQKTRVIHYGDSLIAGDYVTQTMRRLLQKKFGEGGAGFFLAGKGSPWYRRQGVAIKTYGSWKRNRMTKPKIKDRSYGLGGVTFRSSRVGAWVKATPQGYKGLGQKVSLFEVYYLAHPKGGRFQVTFGQQSQEIDSYSEVPQPKKVQIRHSLGKHEGKVKVLGKGETRLFGFVFERDSGVVYDSLGLEGVRAKQLLKLNQSHWKSQLQSRQPDLYVLHYGTNESEDEKLKIGKYKTQLARVIDRFKQALPHASCLLVSPMDRGRKSTKTGKIVSRMIVKKIVDAQREVALSKKCAFWSTYDAMGGFGSMRRWYEAKPKLAAGDYTHPTRRGANRVGAMFFTAFMEAFQKASF